MLGDRGPWVPKGEPHPNLVICLDSVVVRESNCKLQRFGTDHVGAWSNKSTVDLLRCQIVHYGCGKHSLGGVVSFCQECLNEWDGCRSRGVLEVAHTEDGLVYSRNRYIQLHHDSRVEERAIVNGDALSQGLAECDVREVVLVAFDSPLLRRVIRSDEVAWFWYQQPHDIVLREVGVRVICNRGCKDDARDIVHCGRTGYDAKQ